MDTEPDPLPTVIEIVSRMTADWTLDIDKLDARTRLSADLGFSSVDVMHLFAKISMRFQRNFRYDALVVDADGNYRTELTLGELAGYLADCLRLPPDDTPRPA